MDNTANTNDLEKYKIYYEELRKQSESWHYCPHCGKRLEPPYRPAPNYTPYYPYYPYYPVYQAEPYITYAQPYITHTTSANSAIDAALCQETKGGTGL